MPTRVAVDHGEEGGRLRNRHVVGEERGGQEADRRPPPHRAADGPGVGQQLFSGRGERRVGRVVQLEQAAPGEGLGGGIATQDGHLLHALGRRSETVTVRGEHRHEHGHLVGPTRLADLRVCAGQRPDSIVECEAVGEIARDHRVRRHRPESVVPDLEVEPVAGVERWSEPPDGLGRRLLAEERPHRGGHGGEVLEASRRPEPLGGGPEIVDGGEEHGSGLVVVGTAHAGALPERHRQEVVREAGAGRLRFAGVGEAVVAVLTKGLEEPVAAGLAVVVHQRALDQAGHLVEHRELVAVGTRDDGGGVGEAEAAGEHRQGAEDPLLVGVEQPVGPVDRGQQGAVALVAAAGAGQESEPLAEVGADVGGGHGADAGRGQLDGEGDAVEAAADLDHVLEVVVTHGEAAADGGGPLLEQPQRGVLGGSHAERGRVGQGEGAEVLDRLAGHVEGLAGGRQQSDVGRAREDLLGQVGGGVDHVLAVVEHEQGGAAGEVVDEGVGAGRRAGGPHGRTHGADHVAAVEGGHEVDEPHAVGVLAGEGAGDLDGEAGLAHPADARDGHEAVVGELGHHGGDVVLPADEVGRRGWQVRGDEGVRAQRRERLGADLVHVDRGEEVAQAVLAQVEGRGWVLHHAEGRGRAHDLAAVGERHQAGGAVDRAAEVVAVALDRLAGVDAHAHPQWGVGRPVLGGEGGLAFGGGRQRVAGPGEGNGEAVAAGGEHLAAAAVEHRPEQLVVAGQRRLHGRRVVLPQPGGALDVGEEERHRPLRPPAHPRTVPLVGGRRSAVGRRRSPWRRHVLVAAVPATCVTASRRVVAAARSLRFRVLPLSASEVPSCSRSGGAVPTLPTDISL